MNQKPIFIHIPKTGGTSINCLMQGTQWQTPPDYHYRHIIYETKQSNCGDIFQVDNEQKYQHETIFTMLRHPVDRLISEYYFLRKHDEFMSLLKSTPRNFEEFIELKQTHNYMLKFLNGGAIYGADVIDSVRTKEIIKTIDTLNIHVGIFEHFDLSLNYFAQACDIEWPKQIAVKRATINRPHIKTISKALQNSIIESNNFDYQLYQHCLDNLLARSSTLSSSKFAHKGDRFEHILPYTTRFCILEIELQNERFIQLNKKFLMTLNVYLHKTVKTGKEYAKKWVKLFKEHVTFYYSGTLFAKKVKQVKRSTPLDEIIAIAQVIDQAHISANMGLTIDEPRMRFRMSPSMEKVFTDEGIAQVKAPIW